MKTFIKLLVAATFVAGMAVPSAMASKLDGKSLYKERGCITCHGPNGKSKMPTYPNLAGQKKNYIAKQAMDILKGKRTNGMTAAMKANVTASALTKKEAKAIGKYLSKVK